MASIYSFIKFTAIANLRFSSSKDSFIILFFSFVSDIIIFHYSLFRKLYLLLPSIFFLGCHMTTHFQHHHILSISNHEYQVNRYRFYLYLKQSNNTYRPHLFLNQNNVLLQLEYHYITYNFFLFPQLFLLLHNQLKILLLLYVL